MCILKMPDVLTAAKEKRAAGATMRTKFIGTAKDATTVEEATIAVATMNAIVRETKTVI